MSKYTGSIDSGYKQDPENPTRMIPADRPDYLAPHVTTPASASVVGRPSHVLVKDDKGGLQFCFATTASIGTSLSANLTASAEPTWVNFGATKTITDGTSLARFDISPVAWSGSAAAADYADGDVIFVYNDGRQAS